MPQEDLRFAGLWDATATALLAASSARRRSPSTQRRTSPRPARRWCSADCVVGGMRSKRSRAANGPAQLRVRTPPQPPSGRRGGQTLRPSSAATTATTHRPTVALSVKLPDASRSRIALSSCRQHAGLAIVLQCACRELARAVRRAGPMCIANRTAVFKSKPRDSVSNPSASASTVAVSTSISACANTLARSSGILARLPSRNTSCRVLRCFCQRWLMTPSR